MGCEITYKTLTTEFPLPGLQSTLCSFLMATLEARQAPPPPALSSPFYYFLSICFLHAECCRETVMSALPQKSTPPCWPLPFNAYFCSPFWLLSCCLLRDSVAWHQLLAFLIRFSYLSFIVAFKVHMSLWVHIWKILCCLAEG